MKVCFLSVLFAVLSAFSPFSPNPDIEVTKLEEGVYIYRSYAMYEGNRVSANGLVIASSDEVVMIDTPWDEQQTTQLLDWIDREIQEPVSFAIITHAHMDRIGGIDVLESQNIPTISGRLTAQEATKNGYTRPDKTFQSDTLLSYGTSTLEVYYPGPGHTMDNTVVYLNERNILHGGCFLKSASAPSLGNLEDADVTAWPQSLQNVMDRYPEREIVIPGHGDWEPGAIENTLKLLSQTE